MASPFSRGSGDAALLHAVRKGKIPGCKLTHGRLRSNRQFVDDRGTPLIQTKREDYVLGRDAVILCESSKVDTMLEFTGSEAKVAIVTNRPPGKRDSWSGQKSQVLVREGGVDKVTSAWVTCNGKHPLSVVHPVADVAVTETKAVVIHVKLDESRVTKEQFAKRDFLEQYFGLLARRMRVLVRKMQLESDVWSWSLECPRECLMEALQHSGKEEVIVNTSQAEEESLGLVPVFTEGTSASAIRARLGEIPHAGVAGPTRQNQWVARVTVASLAATRQALLGPLSPYASQWDLIATQKYSGRFTNATSMHGIATSLSRGWNWRCIALQSKRAGKDHQVVTLGSDGPPPSLQVALNGEVCILQKLEEKSASFTSKFLPSDGSSSQDSAMQVEAQTVPDAIEKKYDLTLKAVQTSVQGQKEELGKMFEEKIKQRLETAESGLAAQVKALQLQHTEHKKQVSDMFGTMEKKMEGGKGLQ